MDNTETEWNADLPYDFITWQNIGSDEHLHC